MKILSLELDTLRGKGQFESRRPILQPHHQLGLFVIVHTGLSDYSPRMLIPALTCPVLSDPSDVDVVSELTLEKSMLKKLASGN